MKMFIRKSAAFVLVLTMLFSMTLGTAAFAADFAENTSGQSTLTATATLNNDGSIQLSGSASLFGWIGKLVIIKGNVVDNAQAEFNGENVIKTVTPSEMTMKLDFDVTLKTKNVTTEGYTVIVGTESADKYAARYVASPEGAVDGVGGVEDPEDVDDGTSYGPGTITGACTITAAGKVKVKLSVSLPAYIKQVRWVKGNHVEDAETIASSGTLIAEYYNPEAPVSIPDYINSYSFSTLLSGDDVSAEGYTFAAIDAYGKNVSAKYIETKEFSINPEDYPDLDHVCETWLPEVKLVLNANGSYIAADVAPIVDGTTNGGFEPPFIQDAPIHYLDTDSEYVVVFHTDYRWITSSPAACILSIDPHGCVTVKGATFNAGAVTESTNYCTLAPTTGGIAVGYTSGTEQPVKTVRSDDIPDAPTDGGVYGTGVDDATLDSWATVKINNPLTAEGGDRQAFSVNYVKDLIAALGTPARDSGINGLKEEMIAYYSSEKPLWEQYMYRDNYTYSDLYLHDVYCQGVWDSMPASYGWMQDQYTEPGKYIKQKYQLQGKSYGLAGGGQNPWVLVDYLERNAGVEGTAGEGWYYGYDEVSECPYLWYPEEGIFLSYENKRSLQARCNYLLEEDLGGIIIWEMSGDNTASYPLTSLIYDNLRKGKDKEDQKRIIGYFVNWAVYNPYHQYQSPDDLPWDKMTHINYSFFDVSDDFTIYTMDGWADTDVGGKEMFEEARKMKEEYPDTKLIVSVGGWTRGNNFGTMVENKSTRDVFVNSVVNFLKTYPYFDGIDLDWEYPGCPRQPDFDDPNDRGCTSSSDDAENYSLLCEELRAALDSNFGAEGRNILSACVPASPANCETVDANGNKVVKQDIARVAAACDYINIMTYDYHGAFDPCIGYNSPLYTPAERSIEEDGAMAWSTEYSVDWFTNVAGVPAEKISIGTPFYSRGWAGVKADSDGNPQPLTDPTPIFSTEAEILPETIEVTPDTAELEIGSFVEATATITPADVTDSTVTWLSSDSKVATVDINGNITAISQGTATITATTVNGLSDTCIISVKGAEEPPVEEEETQYIVFKVDEIKAYSSFLGGAYESEAKTVIVDNKAFVPMRFSSILLEAQCGYDAGTITLNFGTYTVTCGVDSTKATFTNEFGSMDMDVPADQTPRVIDGKTYLPARLLNQFASLTGKYTIAYLDNAASGNLGHFVVYVKGAATDAELLTAVQTANSFIME